MRERKGKLNHLYSKQALKHDLNWHKVYGSRISPESRFSATHQSCKLIPWFVGFFLFSCLKVNSFSSPNILAITSKSNQHVCFLLTVYLHLLKLWEVVSAFGKFLTVGCFFFLYIGIHLMLDWRITIAHVCFYVLPPFIQNFPHV